jgi:ParB-like chromosome segregation protein Spo0J
MINWKIEKRNISELKVYDKNPRKFTAKGLADLKKSLENCGDANIITINADNTVLGGHARLQVMKELGYKEVDVKVPDRLLTEKECQEVVIRLNANTAGEWDLEKLEADFEIDNLEEWGLDDIVGFNMAEDDFYDEEELMDNDNLQEMQTNKMLALSKMPISKYLVLVFDENCDKQDFITNFAKKYNPQTDIDINTQYCNYAFMKKDMLND